MKIVCSKRELARLIRRCENSKGNFDDCSRCVLNEYCFEDRGYDACNAPPALEDAKSIMIEIEDGIAFERKDDFADLNDIELIGEFIAESEYKRVLGVVNVNERAKQLSDRGWRVSFTAPKVEVSDEE